MIAARTFELLTSGDPWPVRHGYVLTQEQDADIVFAIDGKVVRVAGPTRWTIIEEPQLEPRALWPWEKLPPHRGKRRRKWT
jgi:hypothetical protein